MRKFILLFFILFSFSAYPSEVISEFSEDTLPILNEELRQYDKDIKDNTTAIEDEILWETAGGDVELKTADDLDIQNMQLKGMVIENRTDDTGCTQTGRIWIRTD